MKNADECIRMKKVNENIAVAKSVYGKGLWTLFAAIALAVSILCKMELSRARPVVEPLPQNFPLN